MLSSRLSVVVKPSSAETTMFSIAWKGGRSDETMLGVRTSTRDLNSHIVGKKACTVAIVFRTLVSMASDQISAGNVSIGPDK